MTDLCTCVLFVMMLSLRGEGIKNICSFSFEWRKYKINWISLRDSLLARGRWERSEKKGDMERT